MVYNTSLKEKLSSLSIKSTDSHSDS